ncbi:hypothetical protein N7519_001027 [Penicillium mononematosum]|uniref:uncharacterized protein n=1 Tax=Penicillium mononematosum TaxID=268346 RepID=UPI002547BF01|nr:uncharacterized protein N7519_001027 [Penicillium mononematosum]KAJ6191006.1 hypothetical protein N7519_001027 [Penicillium mononematosum]
MAAVLTRRAVDYDFSATADAGATCSSFASSWALSVSILQQLNPGITCSNLDTSKSYCVAGTATDDHSSTTSTTAASTTTTTQSATTTETAPSNSPTMSGIVGSCDDFHKVSPGDQCNTIATKHAISEAQLKSWNSQTNDSTFHLIKDGDNCWSINTDAGITLTQFRAWNTQIDTACSNL